jgi:hypothetical protein
MDLGLQGRDRRFTQVKPPLAYRRRAARTRPSRSAGRAHRPLGPTESGLRADSPCPGPGRIYGSREGPSGLASGDPRRLTARVAAGTSRATLREAKRGRTNGNTGTTQWHSGHIGRRPHRDRRDPAYDLLERLDRPDCRSCRTHRVRWVRPWQVVLSRLAHAAPRSTGRGIVAPPAGFVVVAAAGRYPTRDGCGQVRRRSARTRCTHPGCRRADPRRR